ncbi:glycine N-phenylacetyltransferase isoform X1 [Bos indicus]|uniref:Glycine N-acyltransferase-like protein n=1 Tax=Bos indicus TaxID=9915 RepID=A0ABM4TK46_BOSIN|nr:glycine N-phenylacetyltransferase isoform X1 [Bos indicus x Bos taurus]
MFHLQGPQLLQMLEKSLRKSLPESLKVYGTVFHMNQGNPFNLKALVDKWPDFKTVVIRPQEQEMADDFDHYTNTYQIYSKDLNNCQESLATSDVINWKQHLQIQSSQSSLNEVIQNLAATKFVKVEHTQCILYVMPETARKLLPSLPETKNLPVGYGAPKAIQGWRSSIQSAKTRPGADCGSDHELSIAKFRLKLKKVGKTTRPFSNQEMFKLSSMDPTHATLVNKFWHFGGNERSQRFIERCIRAFPTFCLLGPEGTPASWSLMDQTGEIRMGATLPEYRGHGLISHMLAVHTRALDQLGIPVYNHTDKANKIVQKVSHNLHHIAIPHGWNQWNCEPL